MIGVRKISQEVNYMIYPFYMSLGLLLSAIVYYSLFPGEIKFSKFHTADFTTNCISGVSSLFGKIFTSIAYKYADASALAPLWGLQNCLIFLFELVALSYDFSVTDVAGALIMVGSFTAPVVGKLLTKDQPK